MLLKHLSSGDPSAALQTLRTRISAWPSKAGLLHTSKCPDLPFGMPKQLALHTASLPSFPLGLCSACREFFRLNHVK
ncbi:MAG TPA: hypothetical protein VJ698_21280 [Noviherbaspirillum sp.]|uniref:hypothetical protein n=1 Tax=Noviherbaspirillum sp. TaxID=1926288 RepID=UPI002B498E08|nr:hypothetical protein [Noviherbaspirillum sp.]HJV88017.1 hypothetical protein [Noviherbaspirillum sp.]